jgi:CHASE2 domain-containing sensor protein/signal transduction histidine kinase
MNERAGWRRARRRDIALIGLALAGLAFGIVQGDWAWRLDRTLSDLGLAVAPRPVPADVVVIAIDDASLAAIGRWPWRRAVHATLLERLAAAKPRAILLDLVLSEPDPDPQQDLLLARALRAAAPVVLPLHWHALPGQPPSLLDAAGPLREQVRPAQADLALDADGILRHAFLEAGIGERRLPHAALALLAAGGEHAQPGFPVDSAPGTSVRGEAWQRDARVAIRFQGPPGHLARVPYVDVLAGAVPASVFSGKYVLIGMTAVGLGDAHATPVSGLTGPMPGVEVTGQLLQSLRTGDSLRLLEGWRVALASALAALALLWGVSRLPPQRALALALSSAALAVACEVGAVRWGVWVNPLGFAAAALLAYPLWSWRRLEAVVGALDAEIARLDEGHQKRRPGIGLRVRALHEASERLRQARRYLAASLDGLPGAVLLADGQGRVTLANRRAASLFGITDAAALENVELARLLARLHTAAPLDWAERLSAVLARGTALSAPVREPGQGDLLVTVVPAPGDAGPRLIAVCADITPVMEAERRREEALAFVSHDMRSPAASIALLADLQLRGITHTPGDELLAEFQRLATRALELSDAFVRAAQAETKPLEPVRSDLASLIEQAALDLAPQAAARGIRIDHSAVVTPAPAIVDSALVGRTIANLLGNAVKWSHEGGAVELSLVARGEGWLVAVRDHGPGMSAEQVQRLFRAYAQVHAGDEARPGIGLGLQFVRRVAERHGGWVRTDSTPGAGACFELYLPAGGPLDRDDALPSA